MDKFTVHTGKALPLRGWREGLVLAFCQGAPLALLVTIGVRFAPALIPMRGLRFRRR